jgi:hypothetical protein
MAAALSDVLSQRGLRVSPYERWFIADGEAIEPVLTLLCSDVNEYGMPFFHRFGGLEDVSAASGEAPTWAARPGRARLPPAADRSGSYRLRPGR